MTAFKSFLQPLVSGRSLNEEEAFEAMTMLMEGAVSEAQIAAFLVALRMKGETPQEIVGGARAMRSHALKIHALSGPLIDTCGTGGDASGTFNISTTVAFVVAACGAVVAKHGNHSNTSRSGSADVLKALGIRLEATPQEVEQHLAEVGIGFLYAPGLHPAMRHVSRARKELGMRSIFNLLGPLSNPAGAPYQVIGVYDRALVPVLLEALKGLGSKGAMVVHGEDGLDELTLGKTAVGELRDGEEFFYTLDSEVFRLPHASLEALHGGDPAENAAITRSILQGAQGPRRDIVLLNAAAALKVAGLAQDFAAGIAMAAEAIDQGCALAKLDALVAAQLPQPQAA